MTHGPQTSLKYRPDIDGLRAVAVLSVVAFHIGLPLHGGYVGVDIFFTISGFLIGSIILRETAERKFTFAGFYERRIRRIFPALFAMLLASAVLGYRYLLPIEFLDFSKSLAAAAFSVSNIYFRLQSGYFDGPAITKPLLHTWSLAVEEQFYVFLPILLVLLRRFLPRRVDLAIYLLALVSFAVSIYVTYTDPNAAFYLPYTRAWELLLGTMLALPSAPRIQHPALRHVAGIAGLLLIGAALALYKSTTPFPGLAALPPCLGAALIIAAGRSGTHLTGRLLSLKPVVFIGLISYSVYLWHWLFVVYGSFGFNLVTGLGTRQTEAFLFSISLLAGYLSWRFIEVPFRTGALRVNRRSLFTGAALALTASAVFCVAIVATKGMGYRFSARAQEVADYIDNDPHDSRDQYRNGTCFITSPTAVFADYQQAACLPDEPGKKKILVLGDSHAAALWWGFHETYKDANVMQATASGCKPVLHQRPRQLPTCAAIMSYILTGYLPAHKVDAVLIEGIWDEGDFPSLGETLAWLQQKQVPVVLLGPIVRYDSSLPRLLAMSISHGDPQLPARHRVQSVEAIDRQMAGLARDSWHTPYVSMYNLFCNHGVCDEYAQPNIPLQSDYGHVTKAGSVLAAERIRALGILPLDRPTLARVP